MSNASSVPAASKAKYRTAPDPKETGWPKGVPYIIGNEGCERFSFYGMRAILYVYLTYLLQNHGDFGGDTKGAEDHATHLYHVFVAGVYALPMIGAIIADRLLGKYRTIFWLSLVYCAGHACLAMFETSIPGFMLGLVLIAVGSGGIKPCVSANVGDQFGKGNWHLVEKVYQAFYFIINFGSFFSTLLVPWLYKHHGASVAFAIPGVLMGVATFFFWLGRNHFVHVPAKPGGKLGAIDALSGTLMFLSIGSLMFFADFSPTYAGFPMAMKVLLSAAFLGAGLLLFGMRQKMEADDGFLAVLLYAFKVRLTGREAEPLPAAFADGSAGAPGVGAAVAADREGLASHWFFGPAVRRFGAEAAEGPWAVLRLVVVFAAVTMFWALFDQHGSSWVRQAELMDRKFNVLGFEFEMLASQISALNPVLVMMLLPLLGFVVYPGVEKLFKVKMTPLRRMTIGMVIASSSFVTVALLQTKLDAKETVHVAWQFVPYLLITVAEVMVSVTGLEFAYTQAPKRMKSTVMGFWLLTVSFGNILVAQLAHWEWLNNMPLAAFFWVFAALMAVAGVVFGAIAAFYQYRDYTQ